ncbi:MAG: translation elongation factor Ts [Verrucomicrobiales bacterium]|nr:translation elongation factor Ts [Verrucomicrobiales bacterium]
MAEITAAAVGKLREMTNAGLMDCKKALAEASGDLDAAVEILRKRGVAQAAKKAGRDAREGVIAQHILPSGKAGVLVEINCETDFVAKNDTFKAFCDDVARTVASDPSADLEALRVGAVAKIGENIRLARNSRFDLTGPGLIAAYIHTGGKVGVLVEVGCSKDATPGSDAFKQLVKDITLQIAAASPSAVTRAGVPEAVVAKEREIAAQSDRLKGKPAQAIDKIVQGMLEKFFQTVCLMEQGFVKDPDKSVQQHVDSVSKQLEDQVVIRRFLRWQVGESVS